MKTDNRIESIPFDSDCINRYKLRIIKAIKDKVRKARKHFDKRYPLILAIYINEYISIYFKDEDWEIFVKANENVFDDVAPFIEVILWNLGNNKVLSVHPNPKN